MSISLCDTAASAVSAVVFRRAVDLCVAARLFTLPQLSRHPDIAWRSQPVKRASALIAPYRDCFDVLSGPHGQPYRWRLTTSAKRELGLQYRNVSPMSAKTSHWLSFGDLWLAMVRHGDHPQTFINEPQKSGGFDVYTVWKKRACLIEIQLTPLSRADWQKKWNSRVQWYTDKLYKYAPWQTGGILPRAYVILLCNQSVDQIGAPTGFTVCNGFDDYCRHVISLNSR